jgi:hypothetical protein
LPPPSWSNARGARNARLAEKSGDKSPHSKLFRPFEACPPGPGVSPFVGRPNLRNLCNPWIGALWLRPRPRYASGGSTKEREKAHVAASRVLSFCRLSRRRKPANAGDPPKAHGWRGAPMRSEARSGTLGNVGMKCEPADAGDRSPASGMHGRSSDSCQAVSSGRFAGFGVSRDFNPAFRVSGRSTLGFRRVARAAGLPFLRLRCNDPPNTKPEKCGFRPSFHGRRPRKGQTPGIRFADVGARPVKVRHRTHAGARTCVVHKHSRRKWGVRGCGADDAKRLGRTAAGSTQC